MSEITRYRKNPENTICYCCYKVSLYSRMVWPGGTWGYVRLSACFEDNKTLHNYVARQHWENTGLGAGNSHSTPHSHSASNLLSAFEKVPFTAWHLCCCTYKTKVFADDALCSVFSWSKNCVARHSFLTGARKSYSAWNRLGLHFLSCYNKY